MINMVLVSIGLVSVQSNAIEPTEKELKSNVPVRLALQAKYDELPEVKLNAEKKSVNFQFVDMKKTITEIEGAKYCAFRFKTGDKVGNLMWCFRGPVGFQLWCLMPEKKRMEGFRSFRRHRLSEDVEKLGSKGDQIFVQSLNSRYFEPNKGYFIWFKIKTDAGSSTSLSLNMIPLPDNSSYSSLFPFIK